MLHPRIGPAAGSAPQARLRPMAAGTDATAPAPCPFSPAPEGPTARREKDVPPDPKVSA